MNKVTHSVSQTAKAASVQFNSVHTCVLDWLEQGLANSNFPFQLTIRFWNGQQLVSTGNGDRNLTIEILHPSVAVSIISSENVLNAVESLMDEQIKFVGEIDDLIDVFCCLYGKEIRPSEDLLSWCNAAPRLGESINELESWQHMPVNSPQRDKEVIRYHYDVSNEFYKLWLGPTMSYSCAHFETESMNLDEAQNAKLDLICRKLQLQAGETLLDVGCGWGALLKYAVTKYGVNAHGITLSQEQLEFNKSWIEANGLQDKIKVELRDYRDLPTQPHFDKVASVGMVEHVGISNYDKYYKSILGCLKPGGLFLNHGIAVNQLWQPEMAFVLRYVFPDGQVPPITTYLQFAKESGWEIVDLDCWRPHYGKTLRCWAENLDAQLDAASSLVGRRLIMWRIYLKFCAQGFENGKCNVYQTLLRRSADSTWNLPMTRANWLM